MSRERRWTRIAVVCIYEALCDVVDTGDVFNTYSNGRLTLPESSSTQEEDHLGLGVCGRHPERAQCGSLMTGMSATDEEGIAHVEVYMLVAEAAPRR